MAYENDPAFPEYLEHIQHEHPDWPKEKQCWAAGNRVRRFYGFMGARLEAGISHEHAHEGE